MKVRLVANVGEYIISMKAAESIDAATLRDLNNGDGDRDES